jgi:hypothetical protein
VLALSLVCVACTVPAAFAAGLSGAGALSELTEGGTETSTAATTATATTGSTTESSNSNSRTIILVAGTAALLLLVGIAFVILRDARKVAPAGDPQLADGIASRDWAVKQRKRRAKAKAARQQRKRTRNR